MTDGFFDKLKDGATFVPSSDFYYLFNQALDSRADSLKINVYDLCTRFGKDSDLMMKNLEIDDKKFVKHNHRFIVQLVLLIKFLEPMLEQLETLIDAELLINKK